MHPRSVPPGVPAPTGTVTFTVDGAVFGSPQPLSGESAAISITSLAAGSHTVSAQYTGDGNFAASISTPVQVKGDQQRDESCFDLVGTVGVKKGYGGSVWESNPNIQLPTHGE